MLQLLAMHLRHLQPKHIHSSLLQIRINSLWVDIHYRWALLQSHHRAVSISLCCWFRTSREFTLIQQESTPLILLRWLLRRGSIIHYTEVFQRSRDSEYPFGLNMQELSCQVCICYVIHCNCSHLIWCLFLYSEFVIPNDVATAKKLNQLAEVRILLSTTLHDSLWLFSINRITGRSSPPSKCAIWQVISWSTPSKLPRTDDSHPRKLSSQILLPTLWALHQRWFRMHSLNRANIDIHSSFFLFFLLEYTSNLISKLIHHWTQTTHNWVTSVTIHTQSLSNSIYLPTCLSLHI